jgi:hypothetical protein
MDFTSDMSSLDVLTPMSTRLFNAQIPAERAPLSTELSAWMDVAGQRVSSAHAMR